MFEKLTIKQIIKTLF